MTIKATIFAAGAAAMLLAGCGGRETSDDETVIAQGGGATVTQSGDGNVTVTSTQGNAQIRTGAPSGDLPGGLPAYPNAQAGGGMDVSGSAGGQQGRVVTFTTTDQPAQVLDFYANAAGAAGLQTLTRSSMGPSNSLALIRGNEAITVTATGMGGTTQVQIASGTR